MADDQKRKDQEGREVARRDTLKLASALSALGLGLGVLLDADDAEAAPERIAKGDLGRLSLKFFKLEVDDSSPDLLATIDLRRLVAYARRGGAFSFKIYSEKDDTSKLIADSDIEVT